MESSAQTETKITWYALVDDDSREPFGLCVHLERERFLLRVSWYRGWGEWRVEDDWEKYTGIRGTQSSEAIYVSRNEAYRVAEALGASIDDLWKFLERALPSSDVQLQAAKEHERVTRLSEAYSRVPTPRGAESLGGYAYEGTILGIREGRTSAPDE